MPGPSNQKSSKSQKKDKGKGRAHPPARPPPPAEGPALAPPVLTAPPVASSSRAAPAEAYRTRRVTQDEPVRTLVQFGALEPLVEPLTCFLDPAARLPADENTQRRIFTSIARLAPILVSV